MTRISRHFTLEELTASVTARTRGIKNEPDVQAVCNMCSLVHHVLEPLRTWWGKPIAISSGYRSAALNAAVGGVRNSQHTKGQAADIDIGGDVKSGRALFDFIRDNLDYDQLIWEHNAVGTYWIHVSYSATAENRRQVLNLKK